MDHLYLARQWPHKYYLEHWQHYERAVAELHGFSDISVWSGSAAASISAPLEQLCIVRTKPAHLLPGWPRISVQLCGLSSTYHENLYLESSASLFPPLLQWRTVRASPTICHLSLQDKIIFIFAKNNSGHCVPYRCLSASREPQHAICLPSQSMIPMEGKNQIYIHRCLTLRL